MFGKKSTVIYSIIAILFIFLGSILSNGLVWSVSDLFNYLMVIPNAIALLALSGMVINELKENGKKSIEKTPNQALYQEENK